MGVSAHVKIKCQTPVVQVQSFGLALLKKLPSGAGVKTIPRCMLKIWNKIFRF
jgi:hypothetical protein